MFIKYIFRKIIQSKYPACYFLLYLAPCCQSDSKILILFFFIVACACFGDVVASLSSNRKLYIHVFIYSRTFFKGNSSNFRVGRLVCMFLTVLKCSLTFGCVLVFVFDLSYFYMYMYISCLQWLQGRFRPCCRMEYGSSPSYELKIPRFSSLSRMWHYFSNPSVLR